MHAASGGGPIGIVLFEPACPAFSSPSLGILGYARHSTSDHEEIPLATFAVHGPFDLAFEKRPGGRTLVFDDFWSAESPASYLAKERGCYVFAMRSKSLTPIYVGKATKTFKQETFNPTNKHKFHNGFSDYAKGTPLMYFVVHPTQKGKTNSKQVGQIEDFLIQAGVAKNPDIQNVKGTTRPDWNIKGVVRSTPGKRSAVENEFAKLFDIHRK
jgi:hypothetical protein